MAYQSDEPEQWVTRCMEALSNCLDKGDYERTSGELKAFELKYNEQRKLVKDKYCTLLVQQNGVEEILRLLTGLEERLEFRGKLPMTDMDQRILRMKGNIYGFLMMICSCSDESRLLDMLINDGVLEHAAIDVKKYLNSYMNVQVCINSVSFLIFVCVADLTWF